MQARTRFRTSRIAAAVVAITALAASASSFAASEASSATPDAIAQNEAALAVSSTYRAANGGGPLTREQVREQLRQARESGTLSMNGEAGDTPQVLAAREAFNAAQAETIVAEVVADQHRVLALAEAETRRAAIEAESQAQRVASSGEQQMPEGASAADSSETEVRIDVIDMQTSATSPSTELVIVSLDGGDAAAQQAQAMHVRRQLGAMGVAQDRIYVEGADAADDAETVAAAEGDMEVAAVNAAVAEDQLAAADIEAHNELTALAEADKN
ncbi:MAG TPA: hypothetical protein VK570_15640 [Rubrivivax sp.]|jgi:hypothetical protein|nr:hypothetical protein [Rubrivivax sp.]